MSSNLEKLRKNSEKSEDLSLSQGSSNIGSDKKTDLSTVILLESTNQENNTDTYSILKTITSLPIKNVQIDEALKPNTTEINSRTTSKLIQQSSFNEDNSLISNKNGHFSSMNNDSNNNTTQINGHIANNR